MCYYIIVRRRRMIELMYFVHGTTTDNSDHKATGWLPGELTDKGIQQGIDLAKTIKNDYFDVVFCSDLKGLLKAQN